MAGPDKKYDRPEDKPAVGNPDDIKEQERLPASLPVPKASASKAFAHSGRTVRLVVTYGGVSIDGSLLPQGTEFDVEEADAPSYLNAGTVELVKR